MLVCLLAMADKIGVVISGKRRTYTYKRGSPTRAVLAHLKDAFGAGALMDADGDCVLASDAELPVGEYTYEAPDWEQEFRSLKILMAQLRKAISASPSINSVGEAIMESSIWDKTLSERDMQIYFGDPVTSVNSMIENVLRVLENPTWETLAERGRVQYNIDAAKNGWKTIKAEELRNKQGQHNEKFVQLAICYLCCKVKELCPDLEWYAIDTSVSGIPGDGRKPDICLSSIVAALWPQIVTVLELKDVHNNTNYCSAIGQLKDRAEALFLSQPHRSKVLTAYIAKGMFDLVVIENASSEVKHSGVFSFEFDKDSAGLRLFIRMLLTSKINLGFVPKIPPVIPITPKGATVTNLSLVFIAKPMEESCLDAENPSPRGTKVYFCKYEYEGITKAAVLKVGRVEKEAANLNKVQDIRGITRLLDTGRCSDGAYLITHPQGTRLNLQMEAVDILSAVSQIAMIINDLYDKHGMLHRDISIGNIIWVNEEKTAYLIDWATAKEVKEIHADDQITGTPIFLSIHVHRKKKSNVSTDLESLMFVLMFIAADGHLPWHSNVLGSKNQKLSAAKSIKFGLMSADKDFHDWVEPMAWDPDLRRAIRNLRKLFFSPVYRTNVTAEEFVQALEAKLDVSAPGLSHQN